MTVDQFLDELEGYYGKYPRERNTVRDVVRQYLTKQHGDLAVFFAETVKSVSGQYRQPPDVAQLEEVRLRMVRAPRVPDGKALSAPEETDEDREANIRKLQQITSYMMNHKGARSGR